MKTRKGITVSIDKHATHTVRMQFQRAPAIADARRLNAQIYEVAAYCEDVLRRDARFAPDIIVEATPSLASLSILVDRDSKTPASTAVAVGLAVLQLAQARFDLPTHETRDLRTQIVAAQAARRTTGSRLVQPDSARCDVCNEVNVEPVVANSTHIGCEGVQHGLDGETTKGRWIETFEANT